MIAAALTLRTYVRHEYLLTHVLRASSTYQLTHSVDCFCETIGRDPPIGELCDQLANEWLLLAEQQYAPRTVKRMRGDLLCVWRDAHSAGYCQVAPVRIRRIKVPPPCPHAWTPGEVARLVEGSRYLHGRMRNGNRRSDYFGGLVTGTWSSGLRRGDMWVLPRAVILTDGTLALNQRKTGDRHIAKLDERALSYLSKLGGEFPYAWDYTPRLFYYWWDKVKENAGVTTDGYMQRVRVSATTDVVKNRLGSPTAFLGHTSEKADESYIDWRMIPGTAITPTPLPLPEMDKQQLWLWDTK